jgi:hypothetical protein
VRLCAVPPDVKLKRRIWPKLVSFLIAGNAVKLFARNILARLWKSCELAEGQGTTDQGTTDQGTMDQLSKTVKWGYRR